MNQVINRVDPWALQRKLMEISDQILPEAAQLNKGGLLYGALMAEEVGETLEAISDLIGALTDRIEACVDSEECGDTFAKLHGLRARFGRLGVMLQAEAQAARKIVKCLPDTLRLDLTYEQAKSVLDGVTDSVVVSAGACLSFGFSGPVAYSQTVNSNLSKAMPDGKIHKEPDGKWIKGPDYRAPDLVPAVPLFGSLLWNFGTGNLWQQPSSPTGRMVHTQPEVQNLPDTPTAKLEMAAARGGARLGATQSFPDVGAEPFPTPGEGWDLD